MHAISMEALLRALYGAELMMTTSGEYQLTTADLLLYFFSHAAWLFYCDQGLLLLD